MAELRIAFVTPLHFDPASCLGGGERYPWNLANGVVDAAGGDCSVEIVSSGPESRRTTLRPGVTLCLLKPSTPPGNPLDVFSWELPDTLAEFDVVHIHAAITRSGEAALLAAKLLRKTVCVTDHGGHTSTVGLDSGALDLADRVICYSDFGADLLRPKTRHTIDVVKGGVDGTRFRPSKAPVERDRILFVGRLLPHKGIDTLIEALPDGLPLTVCGRPYHEDYYRLLQDLARGRRVEFVTDADDDDILDLYRRAWVTVLPSVYRDRYGGANLAPELMGLTLLESMACGTPVICSRVGAMPEFVDHDETGWVYDSPAELSAFLERMAGDPVGVERMGCAGREAVETRFDARIVGARMWEIYRSAHDAAIRRGVAA